MKEDGRDTMQLDQGTGTATRSTRAKAAATAASGGGKTQQRPPSRRRQSDVIMLDLSEDDDDSTHDTSSSSGEDSDSDSPRLQLRLDSRLAAAADASDCEEIVISDSEVKQTEDEAGSSSEDDEQAAGPHQKQQQQQQPIQQVIPDSEAEEEDEDEQKSSSSSSSSSGSEADEPAAQQQQARPERSAKSRKQAPQAAAAATPTRARRSSRSTSTPAAAAAAAKGAVTTPKRSSRCAAAAAAAAAAGGFLTPASAKARAGPTPSARPVRSCTKAGAAAAAAGGHPSLATPLAKLSLATPPPARALRSSSKGGGGATPAAAATSKAAGSSKKGCGRAAGGAGPGVGGRLAAVEVDGEVYGPGDDVYLMQDEYDPDEEQEEEACEVCHSSKSSRANALLECSTCLRGFHLRCLAPPLKAVPEGDWLCPACNAGQVPPPPARLLTRWQKLLHGRNQLALVHVVDCKRGRAPDGSEEDQLVVRYYKLPQETHLGRQRHHGAREVFLACQLFMEPAQAVMGRASVRPPDRFWQAEEGEGNDVFLCEFEYNELTKTFRSRRYGGSGGSNSREPADLLGGALGPAAAAAGGSRRRRRSRARDSGSGSDYSSGDDCDDDYGAGDDSDDGCDESYRPETPWRPGAAARGGKRRRQGQLAAADRFAGLGSSDIAVQRGEQQQRDAFGRLHAALSLAAVPASLPCRDEERTRLTAFVKRALKEDGGILYICGVPGTGKTALVMEVLGSLQASAVAAGAQFVSLNCLQLPSPQHVFTRLWEQLSGQHLGPARAREALMHMFGITGGGNGGGRRRFSTVIVLDEIDMLMTRDQAVLYQLFDWPHQPGSRLAVIGISNTHDLDQRVLPRIASRLDEAKLAFSPYSVQQLLTIVGARLEASGVGGAVDEVAVQQACRKVASETGDVRRALELLRRGVEIARQKHLTEKAVAGHGGGSSAAAAASRGYQAQQQQVQQQLVEWAEGAPPLVIRMHVTEAQQEMFGALHIKLLRSRSLWEKLLLVAVVVEARATGRSAVMMQRVAERAASSICQLVELAPPSLGVLQHCLVKLAGVRLLLSDGAHIKASLALNVDKDDVALVIREDDRLARLHQLIS